VFAVQVGIQSGEVLCADIETIKDAFGDPPCLLTHICLLLAR
jgi:hypothetical protein